MNGQTDVGSDSWDLGIFVKDSINKHARISRVKNSEISEISEIKNSEIKYVCPQNVSLFFLSDL
jgi:hypothetical protein